MHSWSGSRAERSASRNCEAAAMNPKITVYIASYNYGKYLEHAIHSVLRQTLQDFELLIYDDGSTDESGAILARYEEDPRITVFRQQNEGLISIANKALQRARGEYLMRLDADDFLDENALLVLSSILDTKPDVDLVYPDYYEVDEENKVLGLVRRKKIGEESELLDVPAHGACTMIRTKVLRELGGYSDGLSCQDGYDLWVRFIQQHQPYNVNLPLFYYRKHLASSTTDAMRILKARREIKRRFVKKLEKVRTCLILPIRRSSPIKKDLPLTRVGGKRLMDYALSAALDAHVDRVIVTTEDEEVATAAREHGVTVVKRPAELGAPGTPIEPTIRHVLKELKKEGFIPDIIGIIFYTSPLIKGEHIDEAIDTLRIYKADSVVSVKENNRLHYVHDKYGLRPLTRRAIKDEREHFFEESGAFIITRRETLMKEQSLVGKLLGHIVLSEQESIDIEDAFTLWLAEKALEDPAALARLSNKKIRRGY